ncbi:DNA/RNA non-specific endonuclease [Flagellimonas sp. HMM57]|uniref:DNA/RNA non-specific endonuclease n=1 Tax=unclassified Flagellimonas TaxID=2644544 RepID=UPI0013D75021|nr:MULTISPECIES: DNA/RNA non-specific endonuclease [unclassified Flagellimonas]UII74704.1 DNA/RNA non-specific endonuclease [Flagellimonas sp. HMM57]
MKNNTIYTLLFVVCVVGFWLFENFYTPATYSDPNSKAHSSPFTTDFLPSSTTGAIIKHDYFMLSYSEPHEQAEWVAYELKQSHLTYDDRERPYFIEDPKVATKSADWKNYRGSGYDRGHLCPAGDRRFSEYAYNETFYTSNISPQNRKFNAGIWNRLEQKVRFWCKKYGDLNIITGGVLERGLKEIGSEDVDVPNAFYKVIFRKNGDSVKVLCFLIPNEESKKPLESFLVPIDSIEKLTSIDFFKNKPKIWQEKIESKIDTSGWTF